jgi:hypothetical protein
MRAGTPRGPDPAEGNASGEPDAGQRGAPQKRLQESTVANAAHREKEPSPTLFRARACLVAFLRPTIRIRSQPTHGCDKSLANASFETAWLGIWLVGGVGSQEAKKGSRACRDTKLHRRSPPFSPCFARIELIRGGSDGFRWARCFAIRKPSSPDVPYLGPWSARPVEMIAACYSCRPGNCAAQPS